MKNGLLTMNHKLILLATCGLYVATTAVAQDIEVTTAEAKNLYKTTTKNRTSIHDPSIVYNPSNQRYYIMGSHKAGAYSKDLQNWTWSAPTWRTATKNNCTNAEAFVTPTVQKVSIGGQEVDLPAFNAVDWAARTDAAYNVDGNMWAPDIIWSPTMQKWCFYLSINGDSWHSSIVLLTGDSPTGPFLYQGPVVVSGFDNGQHSWRDTDVPLVLGSSVTSLPTRYTSASNYGNRWPNNIDPCVFYDADGGLWLSYGSWSGGIWMLELDEQTGLRDYNVSYPLQGSGDDITQDPYFGKKIAGGHYVSGEGSYIERVGNYYYLFMSNGGFNCTGGYEMRVFRSQNPNGPYVDGQNRSAIYSSYARNYGLNPDTRGMKIMGAYQGWGYMTTGELSQGHNSVLAAEDGRTYLVYHTRFPSENKDYEGHQVRVHQLFQTKNGWLVASPFEYNGETVTDSDIASEQPLTAEQIAGQYQFMLHKYSMDCANQEMVEPLSLTLTADGKVSGARTGTWSLAEGTSYITLSLSGALYQGVIYEEVMDYQSMHAIVFTACSSAGLNVWGYKLHPKYALAWQLNNQKLPFTNYQKVSSNIDLYSLGLTDAVSTQWTSSVPEVISDYGRYNPQAAEHDTLVTLDVRLSSSNYFWAHSYKVNAMSEANAATQADWLTGLLAHYGFDTDPMANTLDAAQTAQTAANGGGTAPTLTTGDELRNGRVVNLSAGANGKESYVAMPNPLKGKDLSQGATIAFYVRRADANLWDALFGCKDGNVRLYVTGNIYAGFNDNAGHWLDINHPTQATPSELSVGRWHHLAIVVKPGSFTMYVDGAAKGSNKFNGEMDGTAVTTASGFNYQLMLDLLAAAPELYLGNGSFWGSPAASFDDVTVYSRALTATELRGLYQMTNRQTDYSQISTGIQTVSTTATARRDNAVYDLSGRRLTDAQVARGLYIRGGKKIVVK